MKRLLLILTLIGLLSVMNAGNLAYIKVSDLSIPTSQLSAAIRAYSGEGISIRHYNDQYILGSMDKGSISSPWQSIPNPKHTETLYLYSKIAASKPAEISPYARILLDMGSELLISSEADLLTLRTHLKGSFTPLPTEGITLSYNAPEFHAITDTRDDIQLMLSTVSADSVMAFIQGLQDLQTRYALAANRLDVANWIKDQFQRFGIANAHLQSFQWNNTTQYNVVATIEGSLYPDEYIIVGGHHDSITYTTPYVFAPGADDNASGTVAAIEMARVMMNAGYQPKCSIRFVTFAAEEFGLWGSKHYANDAYLNGQSIRLMVNHDMISNNHSGGNNVLLMPYEGALEHTQHATTITQNYTSLNVVNGYFNSSSSDSHSFWVNGYPVIYYFEYDFSPYYHSDLDITDQIDPDYAAEVIRASVAVAMSYAMMPAAPQNPVVQDTGDGTSLYISWDQITDPQIDHFRVYYGINSWDFSQYVDVSGFDCTLENLETGATYSIALCSVDIDGNESYRVFAIGTPLVDPRVPLYFSEYPELNQVRLSWQANSELDLAGYRVYRSTVPSENGSVIHPGLLNDTFLTDQNVQGLIDVYYYYRVQAVDTTGNSSALSLPIKSRPITLDNGVLIVDESLDFGGSNPFQPTDEMVDDFFAGIMDNFETHQLDLLQLGETPRISDFGIYSSILWHGMDSSDLTIPHSIREDLARYLELGGSIFYTGYQPSKAWGMNEGYPATFAPSNFLNTTLGISSADFSIQARFKYAQPTQDGFPPLQVDSLKTTTAFAGHIIRVETIGSAIHALPIYSFGSDYETSSAQGQFNGQNIAVLNQHENGRIFTLSAPLYHMEESGARALVNHVFRNIFRESSSSEDLVIPIQPLSIRSYPNPFKSLNTIEFSGIDPKQPMQVDIYNLKGQKVRSLHHAEAKTKLSWDAKDNAGREVANGIYFIKLSQMGRSVTKKMTRF